MGKTNWNWRKFKIKLRKFKFVVTRQHVFCWFGLGRFINDLRSLKERNGAYSIFVLFFCWGGVGMHFFSLVIIVGFKAIDIPKIAFWINLVASLNCDVELRWQINIVTICAMLSWVALSRRSTKIWLWRWKWSSQSMSRTWIFNTIDIIIYEFKLFYYVILYYIKLY